MARPSCARELKTLRAQAVPDRLLLVDIRDDAFDAESMGFRVVAARQVRRWSMCRRRGRYSLELASSGFWCLGSTVSMAIY